MPYTFTILTGPKTTQGSIRDWINYSPIPSDLILDEAQQSIFRRLRAREMRTSATFTVNSGLSTSTIDADFLKMEYLYDVTNGCQIKMVDEATIMGLTGFETPSGNPPTGPASFVAIIGETLQFDTIMDQNTVFRMIFYKQPAVLSLSNETNFLTRKYPSLLRYACLMHAADYRKDLQEFQKWTTKFDMEIQNANREADEARESQYWGNHLT